ncbi:hypothetical protein LIER_34608 [Lithospermum erythrorhizon]|uniref:Pentatricopeptide repeat-containing protein n=1 Tax=Lithospermum erythrorhizon TaxID=34254 RepID=A0AAV3S2T6_LITER
MRNQWRLLLLRRSHFQSHPHILQVHHLLLQSRAPHVPPPQPLLSFNCLYSSEVSIDQKSHKDPNFIAFKDIFEKPNKSFDEIKQDLVLKNVVVTHDLVLEGLKGFLDSPKVAKRVFDWVLENEGEKLSSKAYNLMVGVLGSNGFVEEFWEMVSVMKKKGYGLCKGAYDRVYERFEKDGLSDDLEKLKGLYLSGSIDDSLDSLCSRVCRIIRGDVWGDGVEMRLKESGIELSSELVAMVVENIGIEQNKGLIFFRWVDESGLFKHDERTYNAMARVFGKTGATEKFWKIVDEMRNAGYEIQRGTYDDVLERFVKKKLLSDAVALYEFAMSGRNKPLVQDSTFLLKKIVVSKELDIDLFSKVVRAFTESGNVLKNDTLHAILKSLTSVGRIGECIKVLKVLQEGGYLPNDLMQGKIAYQLGSSKNSEEASEFMNIVEAYKDGSNQRVWASLVEGYCIAGDVVKAAQSFKKMIENEETSCAGRVLDSLVDTYCRKNKGRDAYTIVSEMINEKLVHAEHSTYKNLIKKLLAQGFFKEALDSLALMKNQGYPPFLDPFIKYLPRKGSADDAITFMRATTVTRFPSTIIFLQVFEAYFKAGKHNEAHDFLSRCPRYIKNNADVLNLFCSMKSESMAASPSTPA